MPNTPVNPDLKGYRFVDYRDPIWGDSYNWDFVRTYDQIIKLAIHHSVTNWAGKTAEQQAQEIALLHKNRGWSGVGYHFIIARDGTVLYVGDILTGRANIAGNNEKIIGICLVGDFTKELPSAHQVLAANRLCNYFLTQFPALKNIDNWEDVIGHKDAEAVFHWVGSEPTTCPSPAWRGSGDTLRNRIVEANYKGYPDWENAKGVPATPAPTPTPTPTPPPAPVVITDPSARIVLDGVEMELRTASEAFKNLKIFAERDDKVQTIIKGKGLALTKYSAIKKLYS